MNALRAAGAELKAGVEAERSALTADRTELVGQRAAQEARWAEREALAWAEIDGHQSAHEESKRSLAEYRTRAEELEGKLRSVTSELEGCRAEMLSAAKLSAELQNCKFEIENCRAAVVQARQDPPSSRALRAANQSLQLELEGSRQALLQAQSDLSGMAALQAETAQHKATIAELREQLTHGADAQRALQAENDGYRSQLEGAGQTLAAAQDTAAALEQQTTHQHAVITELQQKFDRSIDYQVIMAQDHISVGMRDLEPEFAELYMRSREFTMTSWERLYALHSGVKYLCAAGVSGAFVECGVWRGGSMMMAALTLLSLGISDRELYLYDTFEGMTEPGPDDIDLRGNPAEHDWVQSQNKGLKWAYASIDEVRANIATTGYPLNKIHCVKGPVEDTIPATLPSEIALLRLDTDWYKSTAHEMQHLYPRLRPNGLIVLDDYGHYRGARKAVDEYFAANAPRPCLIRVDYAGRVGFKP